MSVRKRNEYLDDSDSDDGVEQGYDSDAQEESRGDITGRPKKRARFDFASDDESLSAIDEEEEKIPHATQQPDGLSEDGERPQDSVNLEDAAEDDVEQPDVSLKKSTPRQVAAAQKAARKSGVVYISRVPPFMKPQTLKHFLAPHAPKGLGRIFLTPEDHASHTKRVKSGGNKKKSFTDGWVEFISKREAKLAAEILNGNIIGGKKGNFYHDDLWSMKYLKGFKWSHLTEQIANENAERAARMREEIRKTRKENKAFVEDFERGKMLETMELKRRAKVALGEGGADRDVGNRSVRQKEFKQKSVQLPRREQVGSEQMARMQRMIF